MQGRAGQRLLSRLGTFALLVGGALFLGASASAEELRTVSSTRITLSDVVPSVPAALADIDLGKAPPPGQTRLLSFQEMAMQLKSAGVAASRLKLPQAVRVQSQAKSYTVEALQELVGPQLQAAMPRGVTLHGFSVDSPRIMSPEVEVGSVHLPRLTMRSGRQNQIATVDLLWDGQMAFRLPVRLEFEVGDEALSQVVRRGSSLTLSVRKGHVEISTLAQTLSTATVGELVTVRVAVTKKVVSARLVSPDRAELEI